jgi:hypothetical protein
MEKLRRMGLSTGPTEGYIVHFLGEGGGPKFLKNVMQNPNASSATSVSANVIKANANIFKKSGGAIRTNKEVYNVLFAKIGGTVPQWEAYRKANTDG